MTGPAPDASCTLSPEGAVTTVLVGAKCRLTYEFDTKATHAGLVLPYVVSLDGQVLPEHVVNFPASDAAPRLTLRVEFRAEMQENVRLNTTHCPWLTGILPRTHPCAFAALLTEAHAAGVTSVAVTSGWRPSFGSIAHRAGLGLDITYLEGGEKRAFLNRAFLIKAGAPRNGNVSEREKTLWRDYQEVKKVLATAEKERDAAQKRLNKNRDPEKASQLEQGLADAKKHALALKERETKAQEEWDKERNRNEPELIRKLRDRLGLNKSVKQLFDPWYMDVNTVDNIPAAPNEQREANANERTHNNHLHITVLEPKIL